MVNKVLCYQLRVSARLCLLVSVPVCLSVCLCAVGLPLCEVLPPAFILLDRRSTPSVVVVVVVVVVCRQDIVVVTRLVNCATRSAFLFLSLLLAYTPCSKKTKPLNFWQ